MGFTKKDLLFSIFTGAGTGLIAWRIFNFLGFKGFSFAWLILMVPIVWILGVNLGYLLGRWLSFFNQFGKFTAIGFTNAAVDFGVLNSLIAVTGIATGAYYSLFKTISFLVALINSYLLNKHWAFEASQTGVPARQSFALQNLGGPGAEFIKFAGVAVAAAFINVGVASYLVNFVDPVYGFSAAAWANAGAVVGSAFALVFSFTGFKLFVFKRASTVS